MTADGQRGWRQRAARLADELSANGALRSPEWHAAIRNVPRHELVPVHYRPGAGGWTEHSTSSTEGMAVVYSNSALFTVAGGSSSSSMPGLMTRMLEALDTGRGHRILEIGTGSGYNAALLCHRLGDRQVFSVDIDHEVVELAAERLAALGYHPTLAARDGAEGLAEHAPYDRIIATCSVREVPRAWIDQTHAGGLVLTDLKIAENAGNLVLLRVGADRAEGRFLPGWGGFMPIRPAAPPAPRPGLGRERPLARRRTTALDRPRPWEDLAFWFFAQLGVPPVVSFGQTRNSSTGRPGNAFLVAADGSWCEVAEHPGPDGRRTVHEAGPREVWGAIERAHRRWTELGRPAWQRFGLTVTRGGQIVWLDDPGSLNRWRLPG